MNSVGNGIGGSIGGDFLQLLLNATGERLAEKEGREERRVAPVGIYETGK